MNQLSWVGRQVTSGAQEQAGEFKVFILQVRGVNGEPKQMVETGQTCGSLKYSALVHPENLQM